MTPNEIWCTAHKYIPKEQWKSTLFLRPDRDPNEMCISCKNEQTDVVRDTATLRGFQEFYEDRGKASRLLVVTAVEQCLVYFTQKIRRHNESNNQQRW